MKLLRTSALAASLVATLSCSSIPMAEPKLSGSYGSLLKSVTRRDAIYQGLETRLFLHAVRMTPELVRAQAEMLSSMRSETPALAAERLTRMQADAALPTIFAITYMPELAWNDWDSKNSVWRIAIEGCPSGDAAPIKVERFDPPFNAEMYSLYPYLDEYSSAYRLQFPAEANCAHPGLLISGALGRTELKWDGE